jgi:hypothetical protein
MASDECSKAIIIKNVPLIFYLLSFNLSRETKNIKIIYCRSLQRTDYESKTKIPGFSPNKTSECG